MTPTNGAKAFTLIILGLAIAVMGVNVASADDAPGASVIGFVLMLAAVVPAVQVARNRLPHWAGGAALVGAILIAAFAAFLTHAVTVAAPIFAQSPQVPSSGERAAARYAAAAERARELARTAVLDQDLPGVSVAVGADSGVVDPEPPRHDPRSPRSSREADRLAGIRDCPGR